MNGSLARRSYVKPIVSAYNTVHCALWLSSQLFGLVVSTFTIDSTHGNSGGDEYSEIQFLYFLRTHSVKIQQSPLYISRIVYK